MADDKWHDEDLFLGIHQGDAEAWSHLIDQYQGRLLRYTKARLLQTSDAEDLVQDTFVSFIKGLPSFRGQCSIETYLFLLLRHEIINRSRSRWAKSICLLQDIAANSIDSQADAMDRISDPEASVSRNIQQREAQERQREALAKALWALLEELKQKLKFQNLMIIELLFYAGLSNKKTAKLLGIDVGNVRAVKHRSLRRLRQSLITDYPAPDESTHYSDDLMRSIWASRRLSCPKRSTLGAFMLQELDPAWFEYVHFHLAILGCHFCRASFKDLQHQQNRDQQDHFRKRILASTIGFLTRQ
jgi:RNA polymerase sigma factor (sigma-70 family)